MKLPLALLLALFITLLAATSVAAEGRSLYIQRLDEALGYVRQARSASGEGRVIYVRRASSVLAQLRQQGVAVGRRKLSPYLGYIQSALGESPPDLQRAGSYLGALIRELGHAGNVRVTNPQRASLQQVLADPRFKPYRPNPLQEQVDKLLRWLDERLSRIRVKQPYSGLSGPMGFSKLLIVAVSVALAGAAVWYLLRTSREFRRRRAADGSASGPLTPGQLIENAATLARNGDYREAVRSYFMAVLLALDERGQLRYIPPLTNREHLSEIQADPALKSTLMPVVRTFDDVWYGKVPLTREQYDEYARQAEKLAGEPL